MSDAAGNYDVRTYSDEDTGHVLYLCEGCVELYEEDGYRLTLIEEYEDEDTFIFVSGYICDECLCEQSEK